MRIRDTGVALWLTGLLLAACASRPWWQETLDTWEGAPLREVLAAWGPPELESTTPGGVRVMVYRSAAEVDERALESYEMARTTDPASREPEPVPEFTCKTYFELTDGIVTRVYARGSGCEPKPRPAQP